MGKYFDIGWIGAGNISWHLAPAIENAGHRISWVYNRTENEATSLIDRLYNAQMSFNLDFSDYPLDVIFVCVSDSALSDVLSELIIPDNCIVVHTSGGISIDIMEISACDHYGVIYPLQTFTAGKKIGINEVPFFIEGSDQQVSGKLTDLAKTFSKHVYPLDSYARMNLHLAAVISSNFTNHMIHLSKTLLDKCDLDFKFLYPVVSETVKKAFNIGPDEAQTGPARRADYDTIDNHMGLLNDEVDMAEIYQLITSSIIKTYHSSD